MSVRVLEKSMNERGLVNAFLANAGIKRNESPAKTCAFAILDSMLLEPSVGIKALESVGDNWNDQDLKLRSETLTRLHQLADGKTIDDFDEQSTDRLGWFAEILDGRAHTGLGPIVAVLAVGGWYLVVGLCGLVALIMCIVLSASGTLPARLARRSRLGFVLIETFAIWFVMFFGGQYALATFVGDDRVYFAPLLFIASFVTLAWPMLRGFSWAETREAIGWRSNGLGKDVLWGGIGYSMSVVCLGIGVLIVLITSLWASPTKTPSHPAVEHMGQAGTGGILVLFFLACVAAPILEETMFRGVLYRHLRDLTNPGSSTLGTVFSVAVSALVSSVLFAAIHPQGLFFVPVLAGLAFGFCLLREWRGSVIPGMFAHGITNFVTLLLNLMIQS
jgi:membrane protease YdiL (CAAX protease family)